MTKKKIGTYHEKRGEDTLTVYKSEDGDVVQIEQYDARAAYSKLRGIDFFTASVPGLIKLLQKAAGIKAEKVEYEYAVQGTNVAYGTPYTGTWMDKRLAKIALEEFKERPEDFGFGRRMSLFKDFKLVKRRKAGEVEDV